MRDYSPRIRNITDRIQGTPYSFTSPHPCAIRSMYYADLFLAWARPQRRRRVRAGIGQQEGSAGPGSQARVDTEAKIGPVFPPAAQPHAQAPMQVSKWTLRNIAADRAE